MAGAGEAFLGVYDLREILVGGDVYGIGGIGGGCPTEGYVEILHGAAVGWSDQRDGVRLVVEVVGDGGLGLEAVAVIDANGVPVFVRVDHRRVEGEGCAVGHALQVGAVKAVGSRGQLYRLGLGHGVNAVADDGARSGRGGGRPAEGAAAEFQPCGSAVDGGVLPCHGGNERGIGVGVLGEVVAQAGHVGAADPFGAVPDDAAATVIGVFAGNLYLLCQFAPAGLGVTADVCRRSGLVAHAVVGGGNVQMTVELGAHLVVPLGERSERCRGMGRLPVLLRREEVDCAVVEPCQRVAVNLAVHPVIGDDGGLAHAVFVARGAGDTGRADAEAHIGTRGLDFVVKFLDEGVYVVAAPVGNRHTAFAVLPHLVVAGRSVLGRAAAGIEIVVEEHAVDGVVGVNLLHHVQTVAAGVLMCGIEDRVVADLQ